MNRIEQHEALIRMLGEAVYKVLSKEASVTNESLTEVIWRSSDKDFDHNVKVALDMLMR